MKISHVLLLLFFFVMAGCSGKSNNPATDFDVAGDSDVDELFDADTDSVVDIDSSVDGNSDADDLTGSDYDYDIPLPPDSEPFITVWKTDNLDVHNSYQSKEDQIELPLVENGTYNFLVDWGDGHTQVIRSWNSPFKRHTYLKIGTYTVTITGVFSGWAFYKYDGELKREIRGDADKLLEIKKWGCLDFGTTEGQLFGSKNLLVTATDKPGMVYTRSARKMFEGCSVMTDVPGIENWDFSKITTMDSMFAATLLFNQDISAWNVSKVTNMERMFSLALQFNQDISKWDVSKVTTMESMFEHAEAFNQDISKWDTSSITTTEKMFMWASSFNVNIGTWNLSSLINMREMFWGARAFNQDLSKWDVSKATDMTGLFYWATAFNQDLSAWKVSSVTTMEKMFEHALSFDQDISKWDVSKVTTMDKMFYESTLSRANYDALLIAWAAQTVQNGVLFDGGESQYNEGTAADARQTLVDVHNWIISDGGQFGIVVPDEDATLDTDTVSDEDAISTDIDTIIDEDTTPDSDI